MPRPARCGIGRVDGQEDVVGMGGQLAGHVEGLPARRVVADAGVDAPVTSLAEAAAGLGVGLAPLEKKLLDCPVSELRDAQGVGTVDVGDTPAGEVFPCRGFPDYDPQR